MEREFAPIRRMTRVSGMPTCRFSRILDTDFAEIRKIRAQHPCQSAAFGSPIRANLLHPRQSVFYFDIMPTLWNDKFRYSTGPISQNFK